MTDKLMTAFDFTVEDLDHNRRGQISPRQQAMAAKSTGQTRRGLVIITIICLAVAFWLALPFLRSMSLAPANETQGLMQLICSVGLFGLGLLFFSGLFNKPETGIKSAEGKVQFISRESSTTREDGGMDTHTTFYIVVGEDEFVLQSEQYDAFTQGHVYRVYGGSRMLFDSEILSVEYMGPP
jgi:hypothetical protein